MSRLLVLPPALLLTALLAWAGLDQASNRDAAENVRGAPGPSSVDALDAAIRRAMHDWSVPGLAIAVVREDSVWFARGYGVRSVGRPEPVDTHTMFGLLSPTKAFTTTALAMLVEQGGLSWDDRVVDHLPDFRLSDARTTDDLRVRDLVSHSSGYRDAPRLWYGKRHDRKELVRRLADVDAVASLGEEFHYNNLMYVVAGEVIETVSGLTWDDFVRDRIFLPLGMRESTTSHRSLAERENVASPHARIVFNRLGPVRPIDYFDVDNIGPAGSIHTSVHEMAAWLRFNLNDGAHEGHRLLSRSSVRALRQPEIHIGEPADERLGGERAAGPQRGYVESMSYGLGWFTGAYRGHSMAWHGGGINGQRSAVAVLPDKGIGVVVLSNMHNTEIALALMFQSLDAALGAPPRDWSAEYLRASG